MRTTGTKRDIFAHFAHSSFVCFTHMKGVSVDFNVDNMAKMHQITRKQNHMKLISDWLKLFGNFAKKEKNWF